MRAKPTEIKALVSILEEGQHEDATAAVKAMLAHLEAMRSQERYLVLLWSHNQGKGSTSAVGPFTTLGQVQKSIEKGHGALSEASRPRAAYLSHPQALEASRDATEALVAAYHCQACGHPQLSHWSTHWWPVGRRRSAKDRGNPPGCILCDCKEKY